MKRRDEELTAAMYATGVFQDKKKRKGFQCGPAHPRWNVNVGYSGAHKLVAAIRGTPNLCEKCGTTASSKFEWANKTGNYTDPFDYWRLCNSCHKHADAYLRQRPNCKYGHPLSGPNLKIRRFGNGAIGRVCRECSRRRKRESWHDTKRQRTN